MRNEGKLANYTAQKKKQKEKRRVKKAFLEVETCLEDDDNDSQQAE